MEEIRETAGRILEQITDTSGITEEGDYTGEDGLTYCGKCHTRKEKLLMIPPGLFGPDGGEKKVPVMCKCKIEERERQKRREEYEEEMARLKRMRDASLMDSKYSGVRFSEYLIMDQNRKAYQMARKYAERFDEMMADCQGLIFYGPVGTGKSFTAACIANELLDREISVIMTSFVKILQNIQTQDEADYIARLNRAKLLILDDLGTERNTDYALEKVYNIVDSRSRAAKPMVLTTNLTLSEMLEAEDIRYKRIYDRIFETCMPVEISGESFRRMAAEQRFDKMAKFMEG